MFRHLHLRRQDVVCQCGESVDKRLDQSLVAQAVGAETANGHRKVPMQHGYSSVVKRMRKRDLRVPEFERQAKRCERR